MRRKGISDYFFICFLFLTINACAQIANPIENLKLISDLKEAERLTVALNNETGALPLRDLQSKKVASINTNAIFGSVFDSILNKYTAVKTFSVLNTGDPETEFNKLSASLKYYNTLILQITDKSINNPSLIPFIQENQKNKQVIVVAYGEAGMLGKMDSVLCPVVWVKNESQAIASFTAQAVFGGVACIGKLDQTVSLKYKLGDGFVTTTSRLKYTAPEEVGINSLDLEIPIDAIVSDAIAQRATPGAVVLVVKDGKVIFNKAYGYHTFDNPQADKISDIFDLASVTKISATTIAAMRLFEEQKLKLDTTIGAYLPEARETNKNTILVKDVLLHQAGLVPYIPFYEKITTQDYSPDSSEVYSVKVADKYYLRNGYYEDVMWPKMIKSHLQSPGRYAYSDLSMYIMKEIIERLTVQSLSQYATETFYEPLGMKTASFTPRYKFPKEQIVPTEQDNYFRKTLLHGFVHDQGAAMTGGVSGHAGLFSSANDLAILFQMMLNGGSYGGMKYFDKQTIELFTSRQSAVSRRGYGFDRKDPEISKKYPSEYASAQTYGHTGYTGTCVWVDPKHNLIYIFLSNRVNAPGSNRLQSLSVRSRIQDAIYQAIFKAGM